MDSRAAPSSVFQPTFQSMNYHGEKPLALDLVRAQRKSGCRKEGDSILVIIQVAQGTPSPSKEYQLTLLWDGHAHHVLSLSTHRRWGMMG